MLSSFTRLNTHVNKFGEPHHNEESLRQEFRGQTGSDRDVYVRRVCGYWVHGYGQGIDTVPAESLRNTGALAKAKQGRFARVFRTRSLDSGADRALAVCRCSSIALFTADRRHSGCRRSRSETSFECRRSRPLERYTDGMNTTDESAFCSRYRDMNPHVSGQR